ncbi:MAG: hypothetical protein ACXADH_10205 [Candidatus Kariarchaeaceae archaeon]|jgi:hypothetical protein
MRPVDLMLDEENELKFKVNVEGNRPGTATSRFVVEGPEMDFVFKGESAGHGEIAVLIPSLKNILKEGIYDTHLEVLVDDKIFVPLEMKANFEKSVSVTAEAVVRQPRKKTSASAVLVESPTVTVSNSRTRAAKLELEEEVPSPVKVVSESRNTESESEKPTITDKDILNLLRQIKGRQ